MTLSFGPQLYLTSLVFDGVFERFPRLRSGVIELGAGWVPEFLRTLDMSQKGPMTNPSPIIATSIPKFWARLSAGLISSMQALAEVMVAPKMPEAARPRHSIHSCGARPIIK